MVSKVKKYFRTNKYTEKLYQKAYYIKNYKIYKDLQERKKYVQKNGLLVIEKLSNTLTNMKVDWFFDFGTLLGIVRENQLLKGDLDIDLGIIGDIEVRKKVRKKLVELGFDVFDDFTLYNNIAEESYLYENIKIDISYYENTTNNSICYLFSRDPNREYVTNEFDVIKFTYAKINKTEQREFHGIKIKTPENVELFLEEKYGEKWRVPDKNWKYWEAPNAEYIDAVGKQKTYKMI